MKAVLSNRIFLEVDAKLSESIRKELTYIIAPRQPTEKPETVINYVSIRDNLLSIPAGRQDLIPDTHEIIDRRSCGQVLLPPMRKDLVLREDQQRAVDRRKDNYIIHAKPSWGKTFTGVALIKAIGCKALIVVHTRMLLNQWKEQIEYSLGFTPSIIGDRQYSTDKPIIVGMVQTLTKLDSYALFQDVGTLVLDECHHIGARTFKEIADRLRAKHKIGLTATPRRKDGKQMMIFDYIGTNVYKGTDSNSMVPRVIQVKSDIRLPGNLTVPWANRVNQLNDNPQYVNLLAACAASYKEKGHTVLLVSDRVSTLEKLAPMLEDYSTELITSKTKEEDRKEIIARVLSGGTEILLGSIKIFLEGVSINKLSCVVIGSPMSNDINLEQLVGRITRKTEEEKPQPLVVDICLGGQTGKNQAAVRENFYINQGWKVEKL